MNSKWKWLLPLLTTVGCGDGLTRQPREKRLLPGTTRGLPVYDGNDKLLWKQVADGQKMADTFYYNLQTLDDYQAIITTPVKAGLTIKASLAAQTISQNNDTVMLSPEAKGRHGLVISLQQFGEAYQGPYLITLEKPNP